MDGTLRPAVMEDERQRLRRTHDAYAASSRKRRSWSAENPGNAAIRDELADRVLALAGAELRGAREVLDAGCGNGWWLEWLAARSDVGATLHGIDARFGGVTAFTVLSSLPCDAAVLDALRECYRVLAPGGALLVWEPRVPNPLNRHTRVVGADAARTALPDAPVEAVTLTLVPALARRLGGATARLYPVLARVPALRSHRLVCVRRPVTPRPPS